MKLLKALALLVLLCSIAYAVLDRSSFGGLSRYKNVVLITIDTQRADYLSCYGSDIANTKTLDRAASQGVRFSMCLSAAYGTTPSHSSIMTSKFPRSHGVYNNKTPLGDESVTIAEILRQKGFSTAAFVSALPVHAQLNLNQGFDYYDQNYLPPPGAPFERTAGATTDAALNWLNENFKKPSFVWIHYFDPHWTYNPPQEILEKKINFREEIEKSGILIDESEVEKYKDDGYMVMKMSYGVFALPLDEFFRIHKILYAAETETVDNNIARVLEWYREKGLFKNTLFIFVGDHGETLDDENHEAPFTHMTVYQEVAHVPLIVMGPGVFDDGKVVDTPVSTLDIMPTILSYLGIKADAGISPDGFPLQEVMKGKHDGRPIFLETAHKRGEGVLLDGMKYLHFNNAAAYFTYSKEPVEEQLFDLTVDPDELNNIIGSGNPAEEKLRNILKEWKASGPTASEKDIEKKSIKDKKYLDKLKDLGYM